MALPTLPVSIRRYYLRAALNSEAVDYGAMDGQFADHNEAINRLNARMNLISTTNGVINTLASTTSFAATSAQTTFTVPAYNTVTDIVAAYTNSGSGLLARIAPASLTKASATTVTLPSQTLGATVVIDIYTPGSGTTTLASTSAGQGASLVGIQDAGGYTTQVQVEGALQEIYANITSKSYLEGVITASNYVRLQGSTMATNADITFSGGTIKGLRASVANGEAVRHEQLAALNAQLSAATSSFMPKSGGTFTGTIDMSNTKITSVATPTVATDAVNKSYVDTTLASFGGLPPGTVVPYAGPSAPTGWLLCDGSAVSRATYPTLFAVIGVAFGSGDGVTTFNVPDCRGRSPMGAGTGTSLDARALGTFVGEQDHVLVVTEIPAHHHSINLNNGGGGGGNAAIGDTIGFSTTNSTATAAVLDTGGGLKHNNVGPSLIFTMIVKT